MTHRCPKCGAELRIVWSDPRASQVETPEVSFLIDPEEYGEDQLRFYATEYPADPLGSPCPRCGGILSAAAPAGAGMTICDLLGVDQLDYAFVLAEPA